IIIRAISPALSVNHPTVFGHDLTDAAGIIRFAVGFCNGQAVDWHIQRQEVDQFLEVGRELNRLHLPCVRRIPHQKVYHDVPPAIFRTSGEYKLEVSVARR
uniref:hypothetical protein n=1 Tax=Methylobacterium sp. B34 TaxID=95563 RepID=UPI001955266C